MKTKIVTEKIEQIKKFVLSKGNQFTNKEMAKMFKVGIMQFAGVIAGMKKNGSLKSGFLKNEAKKNTGKNSIAKKVSTTKEKDYSEGEGKKSVRNFTVRFMEESFLTEGLVLTLSWYKFLLEKEITKALPKLKFIACELDKSVFKKMLETIESEKLSFVQAVIRSEIGVIIRMSAPNTFAHLLLDYCGTIKSFGSDIRVAIENNIVKVGGTIMITLSQRNGGKNTPQQLRNLVAKAGGKNYTVILEKPYRDTDVMITFIVKRIS